MRVWITREEGEDGPLSAAVRACGLTPVLEPVIQRRLICDPNEAVGDLQTDDWLVLTSPYAIEAVLDVAAARVACIAVVGEPSAKLARSLGLRVELVGSSGHGAELWNELRERVSDGVVCYPRSAKANEPQTWGNVELRTPELYDTSPREFDRSVADRVDVAAVASPSAVKAIGPTPLRLASIGRATSAAIRTLGMQPWVEAATPSFESLAEAIANQAN